MSLALVGLYWVLLAIMLIGVVGAVVPALPGIALILIAIVIWGAVTGFSGVTTALVVAGVVLLLSLLIDYLATFLGAKRVGASTWGQVGAVIGSVLGMLGLLPALPIGGPLLGILLGAMAGAFLGEFIFRRDLALGARCQLGAKVSLAVVVSSLVGNLLAGVLALATVGVFIFTTWGTVM
ncbi:MAG: DUF456 family protein [Cyanobacteria bacterium J06648_16]